MEEILALAQRNQLRAWKIIEDTGIINIWKSIGAEVNVVGSLKSGLLVKSKDIDLHIYSNPLTLSDSFSVIEKLAANPAIRRIEFVNLMNTEESCIEWHARYEDVSGDLWKFDMIHIQKDSQYDGYVENVTEKIIELLTPETRQAILQIKYDIPDGEEIAGIEIYHAVLSGGVRDYPNFVEWRKTHSYTGVLDWIP